MSCQAKNTVLDLINMMMNHEALGPSYQPVLCEDIRDGNRNS